MQKRAQTTAFIIIGLLILLALLVILAVRPPRITKFVPVAKAGFSAVDDFVQGCVERSAKEAVLATGEKGGYYSTPDLSIKVGILSSFPYYFHLDRKTMPTIQTIENEMAGYAADAISGCVANKSVLFAQGFGFKEAEVKAQASVADEGVYFSVDYPLEAEKANVAKKYGQFNTFVPARFKQIYQMVDSFISEQEKEPLLFCISCLSEAAASINVTARVLGVVDENAIVFELTDERVKIDRVPYKLIFTVAYHRIINQTAG